MPPSGPVSCHNSAGITHGICTSSAPARFISSRTTASILRSTRSPSGIQLYSPEPSRRMRPARSMSLWLASSASAGASLMVLMKYREVRMVDLPRVPGGSAGSVVFAGRVWKNRCEF